MQIAKRLKLLLEGSGPVLFALRLPFRFWKSVLDLGTTRLYGLFLADMGPGCRIEFGARIESPRKVLLGKNVSIGKGTLIVSEITDATMVVGDNVQINRSCHIDHTGNLQIGSDTLISEEAVIYSHSHGVDPRSVPTPMAKSLGRNCWIGSRAILLENALSVADDTLIAAGSVVTKSIDEPGGIVAGVPAKRVSDR